MAIKVDMEKAYDRIDWEFIRKRYLDLDFHDKWITWIMQYLSLLLHSMLLFIVSSINSS